MPHLPLSRDMEGIDIPEQNLNDPPSSAHDNLSGSASSARTSQSIESAAGQRRSTFNESLNSATNAAKKWLVARQSANSNGAAVDTEAMPSEGVIKIGATHIRNISNTGPIGRGQPLPPPGKCNQQIIALSFQQRQVTLGYGTPPEMHTWIRPVQV